MSQPTVNSPSGVEKKRNVRVTSELLTFIRVLGALGVKDIVPPCSFTRDVPVKALLLSIDRLVIEWIIENNALFAGDMRAENNCLFEVVQEAFHRMKSAVNNWQATLLGRLGAQFAIDAKNERKRDIAIMGTEISDHIGDLMRGEPDVATCLDIEKLLPADVARKCKGFITLGMLNAQLDLVTVNQAMSTAVPTPPRSLGEIDSVPIPPLVHVVSPVSPGRQQDFLDRLAFSSVARQKRALPVDFSVPIDDDAAVIPPPKKRKRSTAGISADELAPGVAMDIDALREGMDVLKQMMELHEVYADVSSNKTLTQSKNIMEKAVHWWLKEKYT